MKLLFFRFMAWLDDAVNHPLEDLLPYWYQEHIGWHFCQFSQVGLDRLLYPDDHPKR